MGRDNPRVLLTQFDCQFRITFQGDYPAIFRQVQEGEYLPGYFKDQCCIIKGEAFGNPGFNKQWSRISSMFNILVFTTLQITYSLDVVVFSLE